MTGDLTIPDLRGLVLTVDGPVDPAALGPTLMHEHLFLDIGRPAHKRSAAATSPDARRPLNLATISGVRLGAPNRDNDIMGDLGEMIDEVAEFRRAGGGAIVEVSSLGLARDPLALRRLSRASGLHVVMGAGWYERTFHPVDMADRSVDELTATLVNDIVSGADGTGVRAGIIGEVGVEGNPLHPDELASVRASGRASAITGAPITFHFGGHKEEKFEVLDILEEEGADLAHVVMGHTGDLAFDIAFARRLLARGVFMELDYLGAPGSPWGYLWPFNDRTLARGLVELVAEGFAPHIVLGHDVCTKLQLKKYGGRGFDYILEHFLPEAVRLGLPPEAIHTMLVDNPARALAFGSPRAGGAA